MSDIANSPFRRSIRGYDPVEVNELVGEMSKQVDVLSNQLYERDRELQRMNRDLADANERATRNRASFSDLGTEFETTLRMAEEQARQIRADAHAEANETTNTARNEAARIRETTARETQTLLLDSQRRAESMLLDAEREAATLRQEAAEESAKAKNARARGERAAANAEAAGEKRAAEIVAEASRQAEAIKREAEGILHQAKEWRIAAEAEQRDAAVQAETERAALYDRAQAYLETSYKTGDAHVANAAARAEALGEEADQRIGSAQALANETITLARSRGERVVATAMARAHAISEQTEQLVTSMLREAELQLAEARHRQTLLKNYVSEVRAIMSSDDLQIVETGDFYSETTRRSLGS